MAENRILGLAPGKSAFFCSDTRFYLTKERNPQAPYPADLPLSNAMKRGLSVGTLVDILGNIPKEEYAAKIARHQSKQEAPVEIKPELVANQILDDEDFDMSDDETLIADTGAVVVIPSDEKIDEMTKKEMTAFIEQEMKLTLEDLGLTDRSKAEEFKNALKSLRAENL